MRNKKLKLSFMLLFGICLNVLYAQQVISANGGNASGNGSSVSYSVGQIVCTTYTGTNGSLSQGVQQPYEISITRGAEQKDINLYYSVYPNPTTDFLILRVISLDFSAYAFELIDVNGRIIRSKKMVASEITISMNGLMPNTYILKISTKNKEVKSFKIIKK